MKKENQHLDYVSPELGEIVITLEKGIFQTQNSPGGNAEDPIEGGSGNF